jgi:hypothetical protein
MPKIRYVPTYPGLAGYFYTGDDTIYISSQVQANAPHLYTMGVIVHEMTHYIDDQLHNLSHADTKEEQCLAEAKAWHVNNAFLHWIGQPELADYEWYKRYGCEAPGPVTGHYGNY